MNKRRGMAIDILLLIVGAIDSLLIGLYAVQWNLYTGSSLVEALGLSITFTGAAITFFEFAVDRFLKSQYKFGAFLILMWFIIAAYSMQQTINSQYVSVMKEQQKVQTANSQSINNKAELDAIDSEVKRLEETMKVSQKRMSEIDKLLATMNTVEQAATYRTTISGLTAERDRLQININKTLAAISQRADRRLELLSTDAAGISRSQNKDIFAFYSQVLSINRTDLIQFGLAVFKGVVLDLINILCFMFVLLRSKEHEPNFAVNIREPDLVPGEGANGLHIQDGGVKPSSPEHRIAAYLYGAAGQNRNGTVISERRANAELGIATEDYRRIIQLGLLHGVFRRSGGRVYHVAGYSEAAFIKEVSE